MGVLNSGISALNAVRAEQQRVCEQVLGRSDEMKVSAPDENPSFHSCDLELEKTELGNMRERDELKQKEELIRPQEASYKALQEESKDPLRKNRQELLQEMLDEQKLAKQAEKERLKEKKKEEMADRRRIGGEVRKKMQEEK